jgi:hypothetical protein
VLLHRHFPLKYRHFPLKFWLRGDFFRVVDDARLHSINVENGQPVSVAVQGSGHEPQSVRGARVRIWCGRRIGLAAAGE